MQTQVLIIGGGLSGLHTAYSLQKQDISFLLVEARDRLGGRILSFNAEDGDYVADQPGFDLGPTWFWRGQNRMLRLISELGLTEDVFEQHTSGMTVFEDQNGRVAQMQGNGAMAGSYRMVGGIRQAIAGLEKQIPSDKLLTNARVTALHKRETGISTNVILDNHETQVESKFVVITVPPRLAAETFHYSPSFSAERISQLKNISTWMAGHSKVVAVYDKPFWRDQGFSGDAMSRHGPLQEVHDASPPAGGPYALFGFVGVPAAARIDKTNELKIAAVEQLSRLFGESAENPLNVYIKDWASDPFTSTLEDREAMMFHPSNNIGSVLESSWENRLIWSGTESASPRAGNNGFLEGALEASDRTLDVLFDQLDTQSSQNINGLETV